MKELTIELTTKCQLTCLWCSAACGNCDIINLPFEKVAEILENGKNDGYTHVRFTGGEPTLYDDLTACIIYAKKLQYQVTLLTNGIIKYFNEGIDSYQIQYNKKSINTIKWLKYGMNANIIINVVGVVESDICNALKFCIKNDIEIHIMKLQYSGSAQLNKLHEVKISITGENGCDRNNKKFIKSNGDVLRCTADKASKYNCKKCDVK